VENQIINIENYIECTVLNPQASYRDIEQSLEDTVKDGFLGICVNPFFVKKCRDYLKNSPTKVITVVGFPLGMNKKSIKEFEAQNALEDGADELDMVMNIGAFKSGDYKIVLNEIETIVLKAEERPVKVIIETDLLNKDEIIKACNIAADAGVEFVKTSTGFVKNGKGATVENVKLMFDTISKLGLKVKASGGIRDYKSAVELINAGVSRIGTSSGVSLLRQIILD
jgi:deoxyribose-phosphate aldolase